MLFSKNHGPHREDVINIFSIVDTIYIENFLIKNNTKKQSLRFIICLEIISWILRTGKFDSLLSITSRLT